MILWYAPTSPFARKVRIAAHILGLNEMIALRSTDPWRDEALRKLHPLAKVPTLVTGDGMVLYESTLICEYLDTIGTRSALFPPPGPSRWRTLLMQGLSDGASTAAGRLFAAQQRLESHGPDPMMPRLETAISAALGALDNHVLAHDEWMIGEIAAVAFIGYLWFRWPNRDWLSGHTNLAAWWHMASGMPALVQTQHHLPENQ